MLKNLFKNKLFLTGFCFISTLFIISILYWIFFNDQIPENEVLRDAKGELIRPPYSWSLYPPLGTDEFNRNILIVMIVGFKYTVIAGLVITLIRVVPSIFIGLGIHYYLSKLERPIKSIADSINYFPITLLAYMLLYYVSVGGVLMEDPSVPSYWGRIGVFILFLSVIFIPTNSVLIANEVKKINSMEFIDSSRVLGASTYRIITKHIRPFLVPQLYIIFLREFIQTLLLMSHLGVLNIFIGGAIRKTNLFGTAKLASQSDEWTGLLGMWWDYLWTSYPWITLIPVIAFTVLILAAKSMLEGIKEVLSSENDVVSIKKQKSEEISPDIPPFELIRLNKAE